MLHQQFDSSKNSDAENNQYSAGLNLHRNKMKLGISAWQDMIHNQPSFLFSFGNVKQHN